MRKKFVISQGRINETLEFSEENKYIYVHYLRGEHEKTAYIIKNEEKPILEYLSEFLNECHVSVELREQLKDFLTLLDENATQANWLQFSTFLIRTLSINVVILMAMAASVYGGFKGGDWADNHFNRYPLFTIIGVLTGLIVGGLICFLIIHNYLNDNKRSKQKKSVSLEFKDSKQSNLSKYPIINVSADEIRKTVREFSDELPKGVYRTILVNEDYSIDFTQLANKLGGIPSKQYYMSKETYEIFEEDEKNIPAIMDAVQIAVDHYVKEEKKYPMLAYDPIRRVNYYELMQNHYLDFLPEIEFYITDYDGIITHIKPQKATKAD
jgi:hypothetical protein